MWFASKNRAHSSLSAAVPLGQPRNERRFVTNGPVHKNPAGQQALFKGLGANNELLTDGDRQVAPKGDQE